MFFSNSILRVILWTGLGLKVFEAQGQLNRGDSALLAAQSRQAWLEKDYHTAIVALQRLREAYPHDDNVLFNLATLYLETGESSLSLRLLRELHTRNPAFPLLGLKTAFAALATGDTATACLHLAEAPPAHATADYWRAWAYLSLLVGDTAAALQNWAKSQREWPENPVLYLDLAQFYWIRGDTAKVRRELASAELFGAPRSSRLMTESLLYLKVGRVQEALATVERIKSPAGPQEDPLIAYKAWLLARLERWEEALNLLQKVPENNPSLASLMLTLRCGILLMLGRYQEALADARRALELNPLNATAWLNKGVVFAHMNLLSEACPCWQKAVELGLPLAKTYFDIQCH